jgi:hypothetical protein
MVLEAGQYQARGVFVAGETASSQLLVGFEVAVSDVFAAAKQ